MSALSELREKVSDLENRIVILEHALVKLLERPNMQDHSIDMVRVDEDDAEIETRTPIGYKPRK